VLVYPDAEYEAALDLIDRSAPYALTGAVFAADRPGDRDGARTAALLRGQHST